MLDQLDVADFNALIASNPAAAGYTEANRGRSMQTPLIGCVIALLFSTLVLALIDGAGLRWRRPLKAQAAILLDRCLLNRFELAFQPCEFSSILSITLHEESGWPKQNDGRAGHPGIACPVRILYSGGLGRPPRYALRLEATPSRASGLASAKLS